MTTTVRPKERLLFEGADWDFSTLQRIHDACEEIALDELGLDVYPNQIEVITSEQMLGCLFLDRHAAVLPSLVLRQTLRASRSLLPPRDARPRLRDRHQQLALHLLPDGGEHGDDADARHRARGLRPQPLLQEQLSLQALDRCEGHPRLPRFRQGLYHPLRGTLWRGGRRADAGLQPMH